VQISKKIIRLRKIDRTHQVHLILWDLAGEDDVHQIRTSYLRGSAGYLLVVDGTRRATLDTALRIQQLVVDIVGNVPFVLLLNKLDLQDEWEMEGYMHELASRGWCVVKTSAKTGVGVEEAFFALCKSII
jgi:small GTP-binding protein